MGKPKPRNTGGDNRSFRHIHKAVSNGAKTKQSRSFDDFKAEFFGEEVNPNVITHANGNPIGEYAYRK